MATQPSANVKNQGSTATATAQAPELKPPEEQFWQRYSPHQEAPISTVTSIMLHVVGLGLLVGIIFIFNALVHKKDEPLPVDVVQIGGGGGSPDGIGNNPGVGATGDNEVPVNPDAPQDEEMKQPPVPQEKLLARADLLKQEDASEPVDDTMQRLVKEGGEAVDRISHLSRDTRNILRKGLAAGKGQGGPGHGGGKGSGSGTGEGDGIGPGSGKMNQRVKRILRWTMMFNTLDGGDYASQLAGLGAILAVANPKEHGTFIVYRNLKNRPVQGKVEDLAEIKRIYWVDDKPESVHSLSVSLGIWPEPNDIIAFFPEDLERKLLELELNWKGLKEEEIKETRFEIRRTGSTYEPRVISQR